MSGTLFFIIFLLFVSLMLFLDLGVFHKNDHAISFKEASIWTIIWISIALLFGVFLFFKAEWVHGITNMEELIHFNELHAHGLNFDGMTFAEAVKVYRHAIGMEYLSGYLIEKSLSIDNIFVMIMIFSAFSIKKEYYHRILFYGILGAIVFRFIFIFVASALIQKFNWMLLLFGLIILYTAIDMFLKRNKKESMDAQNHPMVKFFTRLGLSTNEMHGHDFFIRNKEKGVRWLMTPVFISLLVIEFSDIIFAFDSIPAIFSITQDPSIVYYSNIFAILGLRSLFFMIESIMDKFRYLKIGLSALLAFIGVKMIGHYLWNWHISTAVSLSVIVGILAISILASVIIPDKSNEISQ